MDRRHFLSALVAGTAGLALDPERLLWVPGQRTFFLPPVRYSSESNQIVIDVVPNAEAIRLLANHIDREGLRLYAEIYRGELGRYMVSAPLIPNFTPPERVPLTDGGYYVLYDDNYSSFSPAKAFEEGYTRMYPGAEYGDLAKQTGLVQNDGDR